MMGEENKMEVDIDERSEELLKNLMRLKTYERPDPARITRNKQNIMRQVRQSQSEKRKPLLDLLEMNIPWFFAEPKYGIAALFVAFVGLQYAGISARHSTTGTGIYASHSDMADYDSVAVIESNRYPNLPSDYPLFASPEGDRTVIPAGFEFRK